MTIDVVSPANENWSNVDSHLSCERRFGYNEFSGEKVMCIEGAVRSASDGPTQIMDDFLLKSLNRDIFQGTDMEVIACD